MMTAIWYGKSKYTLLLIPFSWMYGFITALIRFCYRRGWRKTWRASVPVIVVGNLTVGGTGKTPLVIWLIEQLQERGYRVGVVSRGYGGKARDYPLFVNADASPEVAGDEPVLIARRTGVPVAVSPLRVEAVKYLLKNHVLDCVIADDGLQHYALARDIEIVVIDGMRRFGNEYLLPAGPMRESAKRLHYVDAVIVNGGRARDEEIGMKLMPTQAINLKTGEICALKEPGSVVAMAGTGNPARFFLTLRQCGIIPLKEFSFADHQKYEKNQLADLTASGEQLLMTEKDAVKCLTFAQPNWWYLPVSAELDSSARGLISKIIQEIKNVP